MNDTRDAAQERLKQVLEAKPAGGQVSVLQARVDAAQGALLADAGVCPVWIYPLWAGEFVFQKTLSLFGMEFRTGLQIT